VSAPGRPPPALADAAAALDRRGFLRAMGAAAAAGLLPTGCGAPPALTDALGPLPDRALRVLTPRTYLTFNVATRRIVGPTGAEQIGRDGIDPAALADDWLARFGPSGELLQTALLTLEFAVWPLAAKLRPFSALVPDAQDAVLTQLQTGRWDLQRQLYAGVKTLACLAFYAHPESHAAIGYPGPFGGKGVGINDAMLVSRGG
jgi:hypothetical protein